MFKVYFENGDYAMLTGNHKLITTNDENITVYEMISKISKGETVEIVSKH
ncbi:putative phosphate starvation-induced protein [Campylobacter phage CP21]|uniref:Phosphate starvation-induced protein n=1 Tax=Campylobacter phage CP21 TaxID=2881391 RepID=I7KLM4_9CAUD|nr:putative phosphate starvation-induced protein [Campylobacter phage CP21]CCH63523.1 putative phosphate starvation-induced protein [Campylobacter phage CP21]